MPVMLVEAYPVVQTSAAARQSRSQVDCLASPAWTLEVAAEK